MHVRVTRVAVVLALTLPASAWPHVAHATSARRASPARTDAAGSTPCDPLDPAQCLYPFPNDFFTVKDATTATGRRVAFAAQAMPRNASGVPIDPTEWNRNDGFSPGSAILTLVPGLDLGRTGAAPSTDIGRSLRKDAPVVLLDADTGRRLPYWAELDATVANADQRPLIVRPAVNFAEGHHIVVALRHLENGQGATIPPGDAFRTYRDKRASADPLVEQRRPHMEELFARLRRAGVARGDLYSSWDFTVASGRNLSERLLHIRDDAFRTLGGKAPAFQVTGVEDNLDDRVARRVTGTFTVPKYLTGDGGPGTRFDTGADGLPRRNGDLAASFICIVPRAALHADGSVTPARAGVYGHGLLGSNREVGAGNVRDMANEDDFVFCATKWLGFSDEDIGNAVSALQDLSRFPTLADRTQQGILDTLFLGRLMIARGGLDSNPAFQGRGGEGVIDTKALFYDGNSQGGILGGATTAVAQDWTRAVLGVPGMNYSTLLQRSSDWATYRAVFDPAYPDGAQHSLIIDVIQMLWDRGEADGYAQHMTSHPYSRTPAHTVLLDEAFGDFQVANVATEVEARTIGARAHRPALAEGRSPDRVPLWGIGGLRPSQSSGSAIVVWDSGTPARPPVDLAPTDGRDPHEDPRASKAAREQKSAFLDPHGRLVDVCHAQPCTAAPPS